ncbi:MAG: DinB family protein [Terriglobia bacterium]
MATNYVYTAIPDSDIPKAPSPIFQHLLETYASETNKVISVWHEFAPGDMPYQPHRRASSVEDIMKHQLLSERRFFGEFLGSPEPSPSEILPQGRSPEDYANRMVQLAFPRLAFFAAQNEKWWLERVSFFDVARERIWIFWRRVLHTTHHRTQLAVYLRLLNRAVPSTYGPTADVTWKGADPTVTVEAAGRK